MKKVLLSLGACAVASSSLASVNLNLDQEYWTVNQGGSVTISGTIALTPGWDVTGWALESPGNGTDFLGAAIDPTFEAYYLSTTNADYTGPLFTVSADAAATLGLYDYNTGFQTGSDRSEFGVYATRLADNAHAADFENYGVTVQAVPEPASFAALGVGIVALVRRLRRA
jgi:hypothetical protein